MKKLYQAFVVGALVVAPFAVSPAASAATCPVGYTGPGSENICTRVTTEVCEVTNDNTVLVNNGSTQVVLTGDASSGDNGGGGGAQSGSATNENGFTFNVTVQNSTCTVLATVAPTPEPQPQPEPAAVVKEEVPAPNVEAAPVLARTSADATTTLVVSILGATVGGLALLKLASVIARRR